MPPYSEQVHFSAPLRDVRLLSQSDREKRFAAQLRESYEHGLRDGERKLGEQLVQQRSEVLALKDGVLDALRQALPGVVSECQDALIALSLQVAEKLVAGMPISPEMVETAVREAVAGVQEATEYTILLNPEDLELLEKFESPIKQTAEGIQFQSSTEVTRGGCMIQTRFGTVDTRRETKLALLQKNLQN